MEIIPEEMESDIVEIETVTTEEVMESIETEPAPAETAPEDLEDKSTGYRPISLRELPSFLSEVTIANTRRETILKLKERLSSSRELLLQGLATKPWLRSPNTTDLPPGERTRNFSEDTITSDTSDNSLPETVIVLDTE